MDDTAFQQSLKEIEGRCIGCGFLAKHATPGSGDTTHFEAELDERVKGNLFRHMVRRTDGHFVTVPLCFRNVHPIGVEIRDLARDQSGLSPPEAAIQVIMKDRGCTKWYQYQPGRIPKEHLDELKLLEMEQRREDFERRLEEDRQAAAQEIEEDRRGFEETLSRQAEEAEDRRHNLVRWITVAAVFLAFAQVLAAILGAGPASLIGRWLGL